MEKLGGNIELHNFEPSSGLEPAQVVVVKKMVGNFVKEISQKVEVKKCSVDLKDKGKNCIIVTLNDITEILEGDNLFFVLGEVLNKVNNKV